MRDAKGRLVGLRWLIQDITRRCRAEEALRGSEERFRVFMQNLPGIAFMKDVRGRYVFVNTVVAKMFGKSLDEWIGKTDQDLGLTVVPSHKKGHHLVIESREVLQTITTISEEDGLHSWLVNQFPVSDKTGTPMMVGVIAIDITAQKKTEEALRKSEKALQRSQEELRALAARLRLAYQLHPAILDDLGLTVALQSFVRDFALREKVEVKFTHQTLPDRLPPEIASCLYRVTQESLRNVARHARTSRASVTLKKTQQGIFVSIKDLGVGFDPDSTRGQGGLGIISMEERVRIVGGRLYLKSSPGHGTEVVATIPLPERMT